jgi:hypothetical protein
MLCAAALLDILNGRVDSGLALLEQDIAFYRKMLAARETVLIDTMIALSQLNKHSRLASRLIEQDAFETRDHRERLRAMLAPLPDPIDCFVNALRGEKRWGLRNMDDLIHMSETPRDGDDITPHYPAFLKPLFFKRNMTANLLSDYYDEMIHYVREMPLERISSGHDAIPWRFSTRRPWIFPWKNWMGEQWVMEGEADYFRYLARVCDSAAYVQFARAQLEYRLAEKKDAAPEKILARLGPETFNPCTGQPFAWNAERKTLVFVPIVGQPKYLLRKGVEASLH